MPDVRFNAWRDFLLDSDSFNKLNKNSDLAIDMLLRNDDNSDRTFLEAIRKNP